MTLGIYIRQLLIVTLIVFNKILSAIIVRLRIFPFSISIILTSFSRGALAVIVASVPCSASLLSCLV
jgi:hypothetical protein